MKRMKKIRRDGREPHFKARYPRLTVATMSQNEHWFAGTTSSPLRTRTRRASGALWQRRFTGFVRTLKAQNARAVTWPLVGSMGLGLAALHAFIAERGTKKTKWEDKGGKAEGE